MDLKRENRSKDFGKHVTFIHSVHLDNLNASVSCNEIWIQGHTELRWKPLSAVTQENVIDPRNELHNEGYFFAREICAKTDCAVGGRWRVCISTQSLK